MVMDELDLEAELFDELYSSTPPTEEEEGRNVRNSGGKVFSLVDVAEAREDNGALSSSPSKGQQQRQQRHSLGGSSCQCSGQAVSMIAVSPSAEDAELFSGLRAARRRSEGSSIICQSGFGNGKQGLDIVSSVDHALSCVVARAACDAKRESAEAEEGVSSLFGKIAPAAFIYARPNNLISRFGRRTMASATVQDIEQAFQKRFGSGRIPTQEAEELVENMLRGQQVNRLDTLLEVFDLFREDEFDKSQILRKEYAQYLESCSGHVNEMELHAFLNLVLCSAQQPTAPLLNVIKRVSRGLPHLYVMEHEPSLRFTIGRAALCMVRALVITYQLVIDHTRELPSAIADLNLMIQLLTHAIIRFFPALATATLEERETTSEQDRVGSKPLSEHASLAVRCAVEETVAVPIYQNVLKPLFICHDELASKDREIKAVCDALYTIGNPHALLENLQVAPAMRLPDEQSPYAPVVELLGLVWSPDSRGGAGPTAKARVLVRASRTIPECLAKAGQEVAARSVGADDLMPIFIFCVAYSRPSNLASLMHYLEACVAEELLSSESGYSLALMQTALLTLPSLKDFAKLA